MGYSVAIRFTPTGVGTIKRGAFGWTYARFTPTGVGTITLLSFWRCGRSVHPHGRGDNSNPRVFAA